MRLIKKLKKKKRKKRENNNLGNLKLPDFFKVGYIDTL